MINHNKRYRPLIAAVLLATVAACGPVNRGLETTHVPTVSRSDIAYDVPAYGAGLSESSQTALDNWFRSIRLRYGDRVTVDDPDAGGAEQRRADIASVVARHGLLLDDVSPVTSGAVPSGSVRIVVTRSTATVEGCPDWSRKSQPELASSTSSNYGCATRSNLAAMIADPNDLVSGQPYEGSEATSTVKAVKAWRDSPPTGTRDLEKINTGGQ